MQISVATSGYGVVSANNYFTLLKNAYLGVGKQINFSASGLPSFYSTYTGKVLYELIRENLWIGGISGWLQLSREDVVTDLYATKLELASTSGVLNTKIDNVSGSLKDQIWASGSIVTAISDASGSAIITASGISVGLDNLLSGVITTHFHNDINTVSGTLNTKIDNVSGALKAQIWTSGSITTAISNASGAAVITSSGISNYLDGLLSGVLTTTMTTKDQALSGTLMTYVSSGYYPNTGFKYPNDTQLYYDRANRTLRSSGNFEAYYHGSGIQAFSGNWVSEPHTATPTSNQYYYYNGVSGLWSTTIWPFDSVQVGAACYGPTGAFRYGMIETHGHMPWECHLSDHFNIGTWRQSGGDFGSYVPNSTTAGDRRPTISACTIYDEDRKTVIAALTNDLYSQYYITGAGASGIILLDQSDIVPLLGANPYYNYWDGANWIQTPMANNSYMCVWLLAQPVTLDEESQKNRFLWVQGQSNGSLVSQEGLSTTSLNLTDLQSISNEFIFIAKVIIRFTAANWSITSVENLGGSRTNQVSTPGGLYLSTVATDTTLSGDGTASNPLSISGSLATVQTNLYNASGVLNTKIDNVSGALKAQIWTSGSIVTAIANASGAAVTTANTNTTNVSGALKAQIWTSGSIVTAIANASGAAVITASGGAVNVSTTNLFNASGVLDTKINSTSGTLDTKISTVQTNLYNASGLFLKRDGSVPLTSRWYVGNNPIQVSGDSASFSCLGTGGSFIQAGLTASLGIGELTLGYGARPSETIITSSGISYINQGTLGIGTKTPVSKLDVSGIITASGGNSTLWNTGNGWSTGSGVLNTKIDNTSGTLDTKISTVQTNLNNASGLFLKKDGSVPLTSNWNFGPYTIRGSHLITSGSYLAKNSISFNSLITESDAIAYWAIGCYSGAINTNKDFAFYRYSDGAHYSDTPITISRTTGHVGINSPVPVSKLDVSGTITASGGNSNLWNTGTGWSSGSGLFLKKDGTTPLTAAWNVGNNLITTSGGFVSQKVGILAYFKQPSPSTTGDMWLSFQNFYGTELGYLGYGSSTNNNMYLRSASGHILIQHDVVGMNVAIGNFRPVSKLDVSGIITASGGNSSLWNDIAGQSGNFLRKDGSVALTANWDAGNKVITCSGIVASGDVRLTGPANRLRVLATSDISTAIPSPVIGDMYLDTMGPGLDEHLIGVYTANGWRYVTLTA